MEMFRLDNKLALVTGGSYGIGLAIGCALAEAGARVVFNDISDELVQRGTAAYAQAGHTVQGYKASVTDEAQIADMIQKIEAAHGAVDILVNNAGIIKRAPMLDMPLADFKLVVDIDLVGPFIMAKAVLPGMISKGAGKIINICSLTSELGRETIAGYASAKGGLKMLTKNICAEFGSLGIQCNGIGPGYIATPQTAPLRQPSDDGTPHPFDVFIINKTPAGRWGVPDDLKGPAIFLASRASDFINGHILYVDGGMLSSIGRTP